MKVKSFNTSKVYIDTLATHFTLIQPAPCVVAATAPNIKSEGGTAAEVEFPMYMADQREPPRPHPGQVFTFLVCKWLRRLLCTHF